MLSLAKIQGTPQLWTLAFLKYARSMWHIEPGSKSFIEPVNPANPNRVDVAAPQRALRPDCDTRSQGLDVFEIH